MFGDGGEGEDLFGVFSEVVPARAGSRRKSGTINNKAAGSLSTSASTDEETFHARSAKKQRISLPSKGSGEAEDQSEESKVGGKELKKKKNLDGNEAFAEYQLQEVKGGVEVGSCRTGTHPFAYSV